MFIVKYTKTKRMKKLYVLMLLCLSYITSFGQGILLTENFNYPADSLLQSNGWFSHSAGTTNPIRVTNGGLSWTTTPYLGSGIGNAAAVRNTGSDENRPLSSYPNSGDVYTSFLLRVDSAVTTANAGYFFHIGQYLNTATPVFTAINTGHRARTFLVPGPSATQYKLGLSFNASSVTADTTALNFTVGQTYLVVVKYKFVPGTANDSVSLYAFQDGSNIANEPTTPAIGPLAATASATDMDFAQYVALRQYNSAQRITVDGIIVRQSWNLQPAPVQASLPITWDNPGLNYVFADFGGNASTLAPSPTDSTNTTLRTEKTNGAQTWAGTTLTPPTGLTTAIPFATGATTLSVKVNAPATGIVVRLKAENAADPTQSVETEATTTAAGWQTLVFNFANQAAGTAAINFASTYNMLSIFYGFGTAGTGTIFYADSVFFGGAASGPPPAAINLPITWDNTTLTYGFTDFGGNVSALAPSPTDTTNTTLRTEKTNGAQTWAGTTLTPAAGLGTPIPFATGATFLSVKVFSPASGVIVRLKAENASNPTQSVETEDTTSSIGWQTLVFNFANQAAGTAPINFGTTYNMLSIFYGFGTSGTGSVYFADSIFFGGGPAGPPPSMINLPITWDNTSLTYSFTDFGGNASALAPSPTDSTNTTLRTEKTSGAQTWAGTTITPANGLGTPIPFAASATTLSVKVFAPASGVVVRLKAENAGNPALSVETEATTTSNGWQTLVFNFANQAAGTAPINFSTVYNMLSIFYGFGTAGTGSIFYADSVYFGGTPSGPPPTPINLPITWDNASLNYVFTDFGGNVSALAPSPTDATNTTLRTEKTSGAQTWAGTTLTPPAGLGTPIPFASTATTLSVKVLAPSAGVIVRLKAENAANPTLSVETEATTTNSGWQTLVFNFANQATGTAPINFATTYNMLSIFYAFGSTGTGAIFYADSIFFGGTPATLPADTLAAFALIGPANNTALTVQGAASQTVTINWQASIPSRNTAATRYTWLLDVPTGNFSSPVLAISADTATSLTLTYGAIADSLTAKGVTVGNTFTGKWTVRASSDTLIRLANAHFNMSMTRGIISSVEENAFSKSISIYPNPATDVLNLQFPASSNNELRISLLNNAGQLVRTFELNGSQETTQLQLGDLANGLYFVKLVSNHEVAIKRLIIQR